MYYLGITLEWDWKTQTVKLLMPGYVKETLLKFKNTANEVKYYSPSPYDISLESKFQKHIYFSTVPARRIYVEI